LFYSFTKSAGEPQLEYQKQLSHKQVMAAIEQCRTAALGGHRYTCPSCEEQWCSYHSCRNRRCPKRQQDALKVLASYVFRVALSNHRIVKVEQGQVTFRYRDGATRRLRTCTLPAERFIHRFLQHLLPKGFVKVRSYGLLAPGNRARLRQTQALLAPENSSSPHKTNDADGASMPHRTSVCPQCGQPMQVVQRIQPRARCPP
jgi:hypothetical protein